MWSYVFDAEAAAFHRGRDPVDSDGTGRRLLHDKVDAAAALAAAGVPVAETIHLLRAGSGRSDLAAIVADGDEVFCKPRRGSAARGVFGAVRNGDRIETWSLAGRPGDDHPDADDSPEPDDLMAADDYVVQRFYRNHPDIARLGAAHVAPATIRAITEFDPAGGDADLRWAFLEVPIRVQRDGREVGGHVHVAIDVGSGRLGEWARTLHADVDAEAAAVAAHCAGMTVPDWQLLRDVVRRAHLCVADVFSVAWDVVPTPDGPVVLEGNTTWSVIVPQQMHGPFLPS